MTQKWLVSWSWVSPAGSGFGDIIITITGELTEQAISEIRNHIKQRNNHNSVVILNIIKVE